MPDYAAQVPVADRWAIAAYIRALQFSQRATVDDVPADRRGGARSPARRRSTRGAGTRRTCRRDDGERDLRAACRHRHAPLARAAWPVASAWWPARIGFVVDRDHFFRSWLIAYLLFLGIALGSMALLMIQHLSGGAWGIFRRVFEASSRTLPLMALLFLPIVLGMDEPVSLDASGSRPAGRSAAAQGGVSEHRLLPAARPASISPAGS